MKHLVIPAIVCTVFIAGGCRKTIPSQPDFLAVHKNTVTLKGSQDSKDTIYVSSNDEWIVTVSDAVDWIAIEPASGTNDGMFIVTSTKPNLSTKRRATNIEIRTANNATSGTITVVQLQFNETVLQSVFGGEGYDTFSDMALTTDGGYIAVGQSASAQGDGTGSTGAEDFWVVKFDNEGKKVWHKKFGGAGADVANSIVRTSGNSYIVLGFTESTNGDVSGNKGGRDAWLLGLDGDGKLQWQKTLGGSADDWLNNLKPAGDGNYLMSGWTASSDGDVAANNGDTDAWIVKVDGTGAIVWEETYGGTKDDVAYDATPVSDGGYIFTGNVVSNDADAAGRPAATPAVWIVKLNAAHTLAGQVYLGQTEFDYGTVAIEAANGDYVFAGSTNTMGEFDNFHGGRDAFICRLSASGDVLWKKAYGGSLQEEPGDLIETDDGDFVFGGMAMSNNGDLTENFGTEDGWVLRLNGEGTIVNKAVTGGALVDNIKKIKQLTDTHFAYVGHSASFADEYPDLPVVMHGWFQVITLP